MQKFRIFFIARFLVSHICPLKELQGYMNSQISSPDRSIVFVPSDRNERSGGRIAGISGIYAGGLCDKPLRGRRNVHQSSFSGPGYQQLFIH